MEKRGNPPPYTLPDQYPQQYPPSPGPGIPAQPGAVPMVTFTTTTVGAGTATQFGPNSQSTVCPHCRCHIVTKVETGATTRTHLIAILLCVCCCWLCACLPYCMDSCKNKNHYCPSCGAFLGSYAS